MKLYGPIVLIALMFIAAVLVSEHRLRRDDAASVDAVDDVETMRLGVVGRHLVRAYDGREVRLRGVNIASLEWRNDGDHLQSSFEIATRHWRANVIRLPLSQDRWFGRAVGQEDGGAGYRDLVHMMVTNSIGSRGYIVLDLHWSGGGKWADEGGTPAQYSMPDRQSALFWSDVSRKYASFPNVIYDLYNEPYGVSWEQWLNGGEVVENRIDRKTGSTNTITYEAVGMQELYDVVRETGAGNIVIVAGNDWGYDLSGVIDGYAVRGTNLVYGTHIYPWKNPDWEATVGRVSAKYAVYVGEWGCSSETDLVSYAPRLLTFMERRELSWSAWCLHPKSGPSLISGWDYAPTPFGELVKGVLVQVSSQQ